MKVETSITTIDNPYSPFDDFDEWRAFDTRHGYNSLELLARVAVDSTELSDANRILAMNQAIDEIVEENVSGMHTKVTREVQEVDSKT